MISKERLEKIKLIALDLDGTTLTRNGLTRRTAETLEEVTKRGYKVVVATGRPFVALPEKVLEIRGLEHVIISNGAHIVSVPGGEFIYSDYMDSAASLECCRILENEKFDIEVFTGGRAFVDKALYDDLEVNGSDYLSYKYILRTRRPVEGIFDFWREHSSEIENVNIYFRGPEEKARMTAVFSEVDNITVTSSMPKNIELGGATTSKATALRELCSLYGLSMEQVMAFGDNPNDLSMIEEAGIGVAMGNATDDVKSAADHIAPTSDDEGVAYTIRTMLFGEPNGLPERTSRKGKVMSKRLRNFILIVIAVVLIGAVVKLAAPGGQDGTLYELCGDVADCDWVRVVETVGTGTINEYVLDDDVSLDTFKSFLREAEAEYTGKTEEVLQFSGNKTYMVWVSKDGNAYDFDIDATGEHIYFGGDQYKLKNPEIMDKFFVSIVGNMPSSDQQEQIADETVYPLEITMIESTDSLKDGEKFWADHHKYMWAGVNLFPREDGYLVYFNMNNDNCYDMSAGIAGEVLEINFTQVEDNGEGKYGKTIFAEVSYDRKISEVKAFADGKPLEQFFAAEDVIALNELGTGNVDWSFLIEAPEGTFNEQVIKQVNKIFEPSIQVAENVNFSAGNPNGLHCIVNSEFSKPEEMDLLMFLRHFPFREEMNTKEKRDLENADFWESDRGVNDLPYPVTKTSRKNVDEIMMKHLGITTKDLDNGSNIDYLKKYDSYYTYFSDYGPGVFICTKGEKKGKKVFLYGEAGGAGFFDNDKYTGMAKLTLYEADDRYMIESFESF